MRIRKQFGKRACYQRFPGTDVMKLPEKQLAKRSWASAQAEAQYLPVARMRLLGCGFLGSVGLGKLAAEAFYAACRVYQALFAGKERVANRADFHVYVALMGRTGLKMVPASALDLHRGVVGMNLFLGHL